MSTPAAPTKGLCHTVRVEQGALLFTSRAQPCLHEGGHARCRAKMAWCAQAMDLLLLACWAIQSNVIGMRRP